VAFLAVADQARHGGHRDRALRQQQLRRRRHPPPRQVLAEADIAELRVRALELARRARQGVRHGRERQIAAVVARDDHAREHVQTATGGERVCAHSHHSDRDAPCGTDRARRASETAPGARTRGRVAREEKARAAPASQA